MPKDAHPGNSFANALAFDSDGFPSDWQIPLTFALDLLTCKINKFQGHHKIILNYVIEL